jgi:hypothetical protein
MSRRRYISTDISTDTQVNRLARSGGDFAAMLYTWLIPHADDDGIIYGDEEEIILQVIPGRRDKSLQDVIAALEAMVKLGLITWEREGRRILFPAKSFYKYQTYIRDERRRDAPKPPPGGDTRRPTPPNADEHRTAATNGAQQRVAAQNTAVPRTSPQITANSGSRASGASPSHSPSHSLSHSVSHSEGEGARADAPATPAPVPKSNRKKPKIPIPEPFVVTEAMFSWADGEGFTDAFVRDATEYFVRWAKAHDHRYADWEMTWQNVLDGRWKEQRGAKVVPIRSAS